MQDFLQGFFIFKNLKSVSAVSRNFDISNGLNTCFLSKIFYTYPLPASFVKKDLQILRTKYQVKTFQFSGIPKWILPLTFLHQLVIILIHLPKTSLFVTQFAGYASLLPCLIGRWTKKKIVIVLGGTDCNWLPSIHYGNFDKKWLRKATVYSLQHADLLLPVSQELVYSHYSYHIPDGPCQGYRCFFKYILTPYKVIPNGIDLESFPYQPGTKMPNSLITICSGLEDARRRAVKGVDLLLEVASISAELHLMVAGGKFPQELPVSHNVHNQPFLQSEQLPVLLGKYQFYVQVSMTEGFPNALIEAMACGCVPIVSRVGAMPEIVGDTGYILEKKDPNLLQELIQKAISEYSPQKAMAARQRAADFTLEHRKKIMLDIFTSLDH